MPRPARAGITLVECLVVLALVVIGVGLMLPATRRVREASTRSTCVNNLKQLMIATNSYHDAMQPLPAPSAGPLGGHFPAGCWGAGASPKDRLSWMAEILPYVEQDALFRQFRPEKGFAGNSLPAESMVRIYFCPEGPRPSDNVTHYIAAAGVGRDAPGRADGAAGNGITGYDRRTSLDMISDGSSNTIALIETRSGLGPWARGGASTVRGYDPADLPLHGPDRPFGGHVGGMQVGMADGSVRFIRATVDPTWLAGAVTIAGRETITWE